MWLGTTIPAMKVALLIRHQRKEEVVHMAKCGKRSAVAPLSSMDQ